MNLVVWLAIGAIAVLCSWVVLKGAFMGGIDVRTGLVASVIGMILWGVFGLNAFNVTQQTASGCCLVVESYDALGFMGYLFSLTMLVFVFYLVIEEAGEGLGA